MNTTVKLRLANSGDAERIARMSRDLIEEGLGWSWIPARVKGRIQARETLVLSAKVPGALVGFAIMAIPGRGCAPRLTCRIPALSAVQNRAPAGAVVGKISRSGRHFRYPPGVAGRQSGRTRLLSFARLP